MKIVALGVIEYFSDISNYIDLVVVICGVLDIELRRLYPTTGLTITQQKVVNISLIKGIRIFRVLRIVRLLRTMRTMRKIMQGIFRSLMKIIYVFLLLILFILIYMIFGMSILKGDPNLNSHINSFYLVFQILTTEAWNIALYKLY